MILLDTHVVLWLAFAPEKLSRKARAAIRDARQRADGLAISDITLFELATAAKRGRVRLGISVESFLVEIESRFVVLPINARVCARAMELPAGYPKDPADRVIGATALVQGAPLLTADRAIHRSKAVGVTW